jgi:hypothetical protein
VRSIIVTEFITLDGVVEAPGGEPTHPHAGWTMPLGVPELFEYKLRETLEAESLLLGRLARAGRRLRRQNERDAQACGHHHPS